MRTITRTASMYTEQRGDESWCYPLDATDAAALDAFRAVASGAAVLRLRWDQLDGTAIERDATPDERAALLADPRGPMPDAPQ